MLPLRGDYYLKIVQFVKKQELQFKNMKTIFH